MGKITFWMYHTNNRRDRQIRMHPFSIYIVFLLVITIFAMSTRDIEFFYLTRFIDQFFVHRHFFNKYGFMLSYEDIVTASDWWSYMQTVFVPNIQHFIPQIESDGLVNGGYILIGSPTLRQIRVRNETCTIHSSFRSQFRTCFGHYVKENEDQSGFSNTSYLKQSFSMWGKIASYYGGGYVETLSFNLNESQEFLANLKDSSWIDRGTRLIVIEFALYNINVNLICNTKLLAEIPPSGGIVASSFKHPMKRSYWCKGYFQCIGVLIFYMLLLYYTLEVLLKIMKIGFTMFLKSLWNFMDLIVIMFSHMSVIYIALHKGYLDEVVNNFRQEGHDYNNLDELCHWNMFFNAAMGICVFLIWIKMFKYLRLNKTMLRFSTTLGRGANDLLGFAFMFVIVFIAYANLSVLLFGTIHINFANFPSAVMTMIRMILGDFNYLEVQEANKVLAPIYFLSYVLFVFFILVNLFLAIVNDTYSEVKSEIDHGRGNHYAEFIKKILKKLKDKIFGKKGKKTKEHELEEVLMPTEQLAMEDNMTLKDIQREVLSEWFEIVSFPRSTEEEESLSKRIQKLENILEKVSQSLNRLLREID